MNALRTLASAVCLVVGAAAIAAWALATMALQQIEDGTAVRGLAARALDSPAVTEALAADLAGRAEGALADQGVSLALLGLDDELEAGITRAIRSEGFRDAVLWQVEGAHAQVEEQLRDPDRAARPLVVSLDVSGPLNARLDDLGGLAAAAPDLDLPSVDVQMLDAEQFAQVRAVHDRMVWAERWGLWLGLALLGLAMLVSHRRRWLPAKALAALAAMSLLAAGALALVEAGTLAGLVPGGDEGALSTAWRTVASEEAAPALMERALWIGGLAAIGALLATALAMLVRRRT